MPRGARRKSLTGYYHIIIRGNSKQIIFENDIDRVVFLKLLSKYRKEPGFKLVAYCLMSNHVHMIIHDINNKLDTIMKKIEVSYVHYFNNAYTRSGHLFQGRFKSEPINDAVYLLSAIRYIHKNPANAGISSYRDYKWSSHQQYLNANCVDDIKDALALLGGPEGYVKWMEQTDDETHMDITEPCSNHYSDEDARSFIRNTFGIEHAEEIKSKEKADRNAILKALKDAGFSVRRIERLTGIGRGIISRA